MKKILWILIWILYLGAGKQTEWYVTFYESENTIHKCSRDNYNEYTELLEINEISPKFERIDYYEYYTFESERYQKIHEKTDESKADFSGLWNIYYRNLTMNIVKELNK